MRYLVTGGTGSLGSRFAEHLLENDSRVEMILFSRDEQKQHALKARWRPWKERVIYLLGDVRDAERMREVMRLHAPERVLHAAALKHVPDCERHPWEAVQTNLIGAQNVLRAAQEYGVSRIVAVSTDKCVEACNAMGMTKALQERLLLADPFTPDRLIVRFGNVIGSRGSVIPVWEEAAKKKEKILLTDPAMTRFLLPMKQAIDLVLHAFESPLSGVVFFPEMGACSLGDLAQLYADRFQLYIQEIGPRPGEKYHEVINSVVEVPRTYQAPKTEQTFFIAPEEGGRWMGHHAPGRFQQFSSATAHRYEGAALKTLLQREGFLQEQKS